MATLGVLESAPPARPITASMAGKRLQSPSSATTVRLSRWDGSVSAGGSAGATPAPVRAARGDERASDRMVVGINDAGHQVAAHHVGGGKADRLDAADAAQQTNGLLKARTLAWRQVDLAWVAGHGHLGALAQAREEHFHLHAGRVLRVVEDDE